MHPSEALSRLRSSQISRTALASAAFVGLLLAAAPLEGAGICLPMICGFTETGKKNGPRYIDSQVTDQKLAARDTQIRLGFANGMLKAAGSTQRVEFQGYGLDMQQTQAALEEIIRRFEPQWGHRKPQKVTVKIVGALTRVPLAHADGVILVPLGMLINAESDDQIAWLLAHEYSHIALGHFALEAKRKSSQKQLSTLAAFIPLGVELAQQKVEMRNGRPTFIKVADQDAVQAGNMLQHRNNNIKLILGLVNSFFSRKQEDQADVAGLDLIIAAKYDSGGSTTAIQMIAKDEQGTQDIITAFGKDFAAYSKKQAAATATQVLTEVQGGKSSQDIVGGLLRSLGRNAGQIALNKVTDVYSRSHRPPDKRGEGILKYHQNVYKSRNAPLYDATNTALSRIQELPEFREAATAINATHEATDIIAGKGLADEAKRAIQPALGTRYANTPVVANVVAQFYVYAQQYPDAERWFDIASGMKVTRPTPLPAPARGKAGKGKPKAKIPPPAPPPPPEPPRADIYAQSVAGYDEHIGFLVDREKYSRALQVIEVATTRLSDDEAMLPWQVKIYGRMRQIEKMAFAIRRCVALEDQVLASKCRTAFMEAAFSPGAYEQLTPADQAIVNQEYGKIETNARSVDIWQRLADATNTNADGDNDSDK